jgi:phosphopantothenoylcysteine decarboxylase/phosphopantothenate--cysteine ligase
VHVLEPESGRLAGGDEGTGRLQDPDVVVADAARVLAGERAAAGGGSTEIGDLRLPGGLGDFDGLRVLVTAGGTREPIDPVRFIGNRSSGKQGYALAAAAAARGAKVTIVSTVDLPPPPGAGVVTVETAAEMAEAVLSRASREDVVVMAAAVADFRPKEASATKLHKSDGVPDVVLEPTLDILAELGRLRREGAGVPRVLVGFAAETADLVARASGKLGSKHVDLVVGNDVKGVGTGFGHDTNAVTIVSEEGITEVALSPKREIADAVLDAVSSLLARSGQTSTSKEIKC